MSLCPPGEHHKVITYRWSWRRWRRVHLIRCWLCDLKIEDP